LELEGSTVQLNVKGKQRDNDRRRIYSAIANREDRIDGVLVKQNHPHYAGAKNVAIKASELKKGARRRVNVALSNARYEDDPVILDDPTIRPTRLFATAYYCV
jgi:hypothetical protein